MRVDLQKTYPIPFCTYIGNIQTIRLLDFYAHTIYLLNDVTIEIGRILKVKISTLLLIYKKYCNINFVHNAEQRLLLLNTLKLVPNFNLICSIVQYSDVNVLVRNKLTGQDFECNLTKEKKCLIVVCSDSIQVETNYEGYTLYDYLLLESGDLEDDVRLFKNIGEGAVAEKEGSNGANNSNGISNDSITFELKNQEPNPLVFETYDPFDGSSAVLAGGYVDDDDDDDDNGATFGLM